VSRFSSTLPSGLPPGARELRPDEFVQEEITPLSPLPAVMTSDHPPGDLMRLGRAPEGWRELAPDEFVEADFVQLNETGLQAFPEGAPLPIAPTPGRPPAQVLQLPPSEEAPDQGIATGTGLGHPPAPTLRSPDLGPDVRPKPLMGSFVPEEAPDQGIATGTGLPGPPQLHPGIAASVDPNDPRLRQAVQVALDFKSGQLDKTAAGRTLQRVADAVFGVTVRPYAQLANFLAKQAGIDSETLALLATEPDIPPPETRGEAVGSAIAEAAGTGLGLLTPGGALGAGAKAGARIAGKVLPKAAGRVGKFAGGVSGATAAVAGPAALERGEGLGEAAKATAMAPIDFARQMKDLPGKVARFHAEYQDKSPQELREALRQIVDPLVIAGLIAFPPGVRAPRTGTAIVRRPPRDARGRPVDVKALGDAELMEAIRTAGGRGELHEGLVLEVRRRFAAGDEGFRQTAIEFFVTGGPRPEKLPPVITAEGGPIQIPVTRGPAPAPPQKETKRAPQERQKPKGDLTEHPRDEGGGPLARGIRRRGVEPGGQEPRPVPETKGSLSAEEVAGTRRFSSDSHVEEILTKLDAEIPPGDIARRKAFDLLVQEFQLPERGLPAPDIVALAKEGDRVARAALSMARQNQLLFEPGGRELVEPKETRKFLPKPDQPPEAAISQIAKPLPAKRLPKPPAPLSEGVKKKAKPLPAPKAERTIEPSGVKPDVFLAESVGFVPKKSPEALGFAAPGVSVTPSVLGDVSAGAAPFTDAAVRKPDPAYRRKLNKRIAKAIFGKQRGGRGIAMEDIGKHAKAFRELEFKTVEDRYNVHQAMVGRHPIDSLPAPVARWARTARTMMDQASQELLNEVIVANGGKETPLSVSIKRRIGTYLAELMIPKGPIAQAREAMARRSRKMKLKRERHMFRRGTVGEPLAWVVEVGGKTGNHYRFDTQSEAATFRADLIRQQKTALIKRAAAQRGVTADDLLNKAVKKRVKVVRPWTEQERLERGNSRDPLWVWAQSYMQTRQNIATLQMSRRLSRRFGRKPPEALAGDETAIEQWARAHGLAKVRGKVDQIGVLAGQYVPKHIAAHVNDMTDMGPDGWIGWVSRVFQAYLSTWKFSKTIANPPTHMRNVIGNFMFADFAGVALWNPVNTPYYARALKELIDRGPAVRELIKRGTIGGEYYGNEIRQIEQYMSDGLTMEQSLIRAGKWTVDKLGKLYNAEDQIFKVAAYLKYREKGVPNRFGFFTNKPATPGAAARAVNEFFPNYAEIWRGTRYLSRLPFGGPFLAFNEQAIRIMLRVTPYQPWKVAKWVSLPGILGAASVFYLGMDDEEKNLVDERRSYFEPILPFRDPNGAARVLDLRYIIPLGNELQKPIDFVTGHKGGRIEVPFLLKNPPLAGLMDIIYNKELFTQRQLYSEKDGFMTRMAKLGRHVMRTSAPVPFPSLVFWGQERIRKAFKGESGERAWEAMTGVLFGVNGRRAYVNRNDAMARLRDLAKEDQDVEATLSEFFEGRRSGFKQKRMAATLENDERFMQLLTLFNEAYRRADVKAIGPQNVAGGIARRAHAEKKRRAEAVHGP
jgi:hypothetical protein